METGLLLLLLCMITSSTQSPSGREPQSSLLRILHQAVTKDPDWLDDGNAIIKRGHGDVDSFWKRGNTDAAFWKRGDADSAFWKRNNAAFWKRAPSTTDAFWKRMAPNAFWKRSVVNPEVENLLRALTAIRHYIERQRSSDLGGYNGGQVAISSKTKTKPKGSYELIDENTNEGMSMTAHLPKEERRREDPVMRPEFNPTGW